MDNTGLTICGRKLYTYGAKMYLVIFVFLTCVIGSVKGFSRCRGYLNNLFICCVYTWYICSAGYVELPIVLLYLLRCLVYHMLSKTRRNSRSLQRVIAYTGMSNEICRRFNGKQQ